MAAVELFLLLCQIVSFFVLQYWINCRIVIFHSLISKVCMCLQFIKCMVFLFEYIVIVMPPSKMRRFVDVSLFSEVYRLLGLDGMSFLLSKIVSLVFWSWNLLLRRIHDYF